MERSRRLVAAFGILLGVLLVALGARLVWVQVEGHEAACQAMARQSLRDEVLPARRGRILDRWGRTLAESVECVRVEVLPRNVLERADTPIETAALVSRIADFLAPRVGASPADLVRRLSGTRWTPLGGPVRDPACIEELHAARRGLLYGVDLARGFTRIHPWSATGGNLIGFVDHGGVGVAGLEQGLNETLSGRDGSRTCRVDHLGRELAEEQPEVAPIDGQDVVVTIDARIQQIVEDELEAARQLHRASRAMAVVFDTQTAEVLALVSLPGLDPDDGSGRVSDASSMAAVQEIYPPGSTFKPLMMAAALELGLAHPSQPPIDCTRFEGRDLDDSRPQDRRLTLEEILVYSSNIGMATILTRIVPADDPRNTRLMAPVHDVLLRLGLGRTTGIPLPAEVAGKVSPLARWHRNYTLASVAFGQELGVSALQMAAAASTLSDGWYRPPRLVAGRDSSRPPEPVFSKETVDLVRRWMARAVEEGGCRELGELPVRVAGKTGTAESETAGSTEVHSFVALVPAEDPVLTLVVALRDPQGVRFSSQSAAPAAARILQELLPYLGAGGGG